MSNVFLLNYKVKGIKALDEKVSLSFYKKTVTTPIDTQKYNIKGIYGMNGSGKSGIIASVDILNNLLVDVAYLNNPMVQKNLDAIINKKIRELYIKVEFLLKLEDVFIIFKYKIVLQKSTNGNFEIYKEQLSYKYKNSRGKKFIPLLKIKEGEIDYIIEEKIEDIFRKKTINLLSKSTASSLFIEKIYIPADIKREDEKMLFLGLSSLFILGNSIYVYTEQSDKHIDYFLQDAFKYYVDSYNTEQSDKHKDYSLEDAVKYSGDSDNIDHNIASLFRSAINMERSQSNLISINRNQISKDKYDNYKKTVEKLKNFIQIFNPDLTDIDIERKEDGEVYVCSLNMVYEDYIVNTEFESTGIKKLIKLFAYIQKMVQGGIVFIDELDSNLHDVYLCALLEYLMEYGKGQLCFTTHNVGPMDVLKRNKKSIDFLSIDHKIYPWTTNGNYSPSKLYKNGMIEGSPFNVDSFDFIGIFDSRGEDD